MKPETVEAVALVIANTDRANHGYAHAHWHEFDDYSQGIYKQQAQAALAALAVTPEYQAMVKDAARYRHVRAKPAMLLHLSNRDFDAAIDAARNG